MLTLVSSPNPFTDRTTISCSLPEKGRLTLTIHNIFGETVKTLGDDVEHEGKYSVEVTSEKMRPGIYTAMLSLKTSGGLVLVKTIRIVYKK